VTKVLVVDDNPDIRLLLKHTLKLSGMDVVDVGSGEEALDWLEANGPPDVMLLDIQMPEVDGWEVLIRMRSDPKLADLAVLLCSVKGRSIDQYRGWRLGCDGYVTKPFNFEILNRMIRDVMSLNGPELRSRRQVLAAETRVR
jgi:CheY-like chemotaxis protein